METAKNVTKQFIQMDNISGIYVGIEKIKLNS